MNIVAKLGISIIKEENQNPKKFIMPLRISVTNFFVFSFTPPNSRMIWCFRWCKHSLYDGMQRYRIEGWYDLKDVTRCLENSPTNRLDHKDIVSVLFIYFPQHTCYFFPVTSSYVSWNQCTSFCFLDMLSNPRRLTRAGSGSIRPLLACQYQRKGTTVRNLWLTSKEWEALLMESTHFLIGAIKAIWFREYHRSKVRINDWPTELTDSPNQDNG
jgi:hypothetical protein